MFSSFPHSRCGQWSSILDAAAEITRNEINSKLVKLQPLLVKLFKGQQLDKSGVSIQRNARNVHNARKKLRNERNERKKSTQQTQLT